MISEEFVPVAVYMGIDPPAFYGMTPNRFRRYLPFYNKIVEKISREHDAKMALIDMQSWATGLYVVHAIGSTFGKAKYPKKPLNMFSSEALKVPEEQIIEQKQAEFAQFAAAFNVQYNTADRGERAKKLFLQQGMDENTAKLYEALSQEKGMINEDG